MLYKMNKPSKNMNLSDVEISRMVHEQAVAEYNEEQEKARLKAKLQTLTTKIN